MAQTAAIRVSVLEGSYAHLQAVGVPLPLCMHMQELGVWLNEAQWTAKQSIGGFSVSFFWPASARMPYHPPVRARRRRRRPKKNRSTGSNCKESPSCEEGSAPAASSSTAATPAPDAHLPSKNVEPASPSGDDSVGNTLAGCSTTDVPPVHPLSDAHPDSDLSSAEDVDSSTESIDLNTCDSVALDVQDVPGVSYVKDGVAGWTPVVRKHRLRKRKTSPRSSLAAAVTMTSTCLAVRLNISSSTGHRVLLLRDVLVDRVCGPQSRQGLV